MTVINPGDPNHTHLININGNTGICACGRVVEYENVDYDKCIGNRKIPGKNKPATSLKWTFK